MAVAVSVAPWPTSIVEGATLIVGVVTGELNLISEVGEELTYGEGVELSVTTAQ
jgi:hypothetical protein